jgi:Uma2 family endonuclease
MPAMPTPATETPHTMALRDWERLVDPPSGRLELHGGLVVVNPAPRIVHQDVSRRLADAIERRCPVGFAVSTDIEWRRLAGGRSIADALRPDVIVYDERFGDDVALTAPPHLAIEVLSPGNTELDMARKRAMYLANGLAHYAEVAISEPPRHVTITWFTARDGEWAEVATATGSKRLTVADPFPLRIVPDTLLPRWSRRRG